MIKECAQSERATRSRSRILVRIPAVASLTTLVAASTVIIFPAVASATTPALTIKPSEIYYPCSEGNVKFSVKAFAADRKVKLRSGSTSGTTVATIKTNARGGGSVTIDFNNVTPGSYPYYAVQGSTSATATLTVGECP